MVHEYNKPQWQWCHFELDCKGLVRPTRVEDPQPLQRVCPAL